MLPGTDEYMDLPYDFDSLAKAGSMLGSGAIIVVDDSISIVDVALKTAKFYRHESCGKCTPCREGTNWTVKMLERIQSGEATPMDLDIMASVQEQIIGNCLCVLGDAMAMPIALDDRPLPRRVRGAHRGGARGQRPRRRDPAGQPLGAGRRVPDARAGRGRADARGGLSVPRPPEHWVTFTLDGREVRAPEGVMLVDGAKEGDVEIPVFCYEPKLGQPVGACRMCLVEIEGIPKLQTACSTPVKDGMVVHTQTQRVIDAQRAVVEFLLINHPLDCPVCDKGGECPLQDITYGWGPGTSRFIEPKRHFKKPLELSPLIAIDRERCILCYRCVRFSQELSEDYQLILLERGAHSYVGTFDGHPYVAPFSGNIIELCPVGALTSRAYRFRARPWDIEGAGTVAPTDPVHANVELTVRDERVMRVLARDHDGVEDGWLDDRTRFGYQAVHVDERIVEPLVREGTELMPASWEKALAAASVALKKAGARTAALADGETTNEEAFLLARLFREGLGSGNLASRPGGELRARRGARAVGPRAAGDDRRPRVRPRGAAARVRPDRRGADARPADPQGHPPPPRPARGGERAADGARRAGGRRSCGSRRAAPRGCSWRSTPRCRVTTGTSAGASTAAGSNAQAVRDLGAWLRDVGEDLVIVYGERALRGQGARALLNLAARLELAGRDGAGLLEVPCVPNARGMREAGFAPGHGPGFSTLAAAGHDARGIAEGLASGELATVWLHHADPVRFHPDRALWESALGTAQTVIAVETLLTDTVREYADVVFPGEAYPEKEGTLTNVDGRVQRLRAAIGRPEGRQRPAGQRGAPGVAGDRRRRARRSGSTSAC